VPQALKGKYPSARDVTDDAPFDFPTSCLMINIVLDKIKSTPLPPQTGQLTYI
jgi:hypothetical protein